MNLSGYNPLFELECDFCKEQATQVKNADYKTKFKTKLWNILCNDCFYQNTKEK